MRRAGPRDSSLPAGSRPPTQSRLQGTARGQTALDFAFGSSLFLLSLAFLFTTLPGIVAPFDAPNAQGDSLRTERVASQLTTQLLADNRYVGQPTSLDAQCTTAFFNDSVNASSCRFNQSASLQARLGLRDYNNVNITIRDTTGRIASVKGTTLVTGPEPSVDADTTTMTRIVHLTGDPHRLTVTFW